MAYLRGNYAKKGYWVTQRITLQLDSAAAVGLTFVLSYAGKVQAVIVQHATQHDKFSLLGFGMVSINDAQHIYVSMIEGSSVCLVSLAGTVSYPFQVVALISSR